MSSNLGSHGEQALQGALFWGVVAVVVVVLMFAGLTLLVWRSDRKRDQDEDADKRA